MLEFTEAKPSRVVILGSKGFIAGAFASRFKSDGLNVKTIGAAELDLCKDGSGAALAEMLDAGDCLVFVSALTPDRGRDLATMRTNLVMAESVIEALKKKPVRHLLYVSSDAVYEDDAHLVSESTPLAPGTFHGIMHRAREVAIAQACAAAKIPLVILRPCAVFGPGDTHNGYGPNRFIRTALEKGAVDLFGGGEEQRDHLYIDDFASLASACVTRGARGALNIASGKAYSFADVAAVAAKLAGRPVEVRPSARANPITHKHFDITNLLRAFPGFSFTPLEAGMKAMVQRR